MPRIVSCYSACQGSIPVCPLDRKKGNFVWLAVSSIASEESKAPNATELLLGDKCYRGGSESWTKDCRDRSKCFITPPLGLGTSPPSTQSGTPL